MPFPCRPGTVPGTVQANCADQIRWSTTLAKHPSNHQSHFTQGDLPLAQGAHLAQGGRVPSWALSPWGQGVKAIWVVGKLGRSRANRLVPSVLRRPSPPELALAPRVVASPAKPRIANPHTWTAH